MKFETTIEVDGVDVTSGRGATGDESLAAAIRSFESEPHNSAEDITVIRTVETT